jgi:hypothetical protein
MKQVSTGDHESHAFTFLFADVRGLEIYTDEISTPEHRVFPGTSGGTRKKDGRPQQKIP